MTLIAAFKQNEVPILLGDFLLTSSDSMGTRKKVHLIAPNLAVAWTSSKLAARTVLKEMHARFEGERVTRQGLEDFLTNYPTSELASLDVRLVGWIVDQDAHCFLWNSLYPSELFYEPEHVDGSGAVAFEELKTMKSAMAGSIGSSKTEQAIFITLTTYCRLVSNEMFGLNQAFHFGFGFEVAYFDGEQFRFVDDILCVGFEIFYDVRKSIIWKTVQEAIYKYRSFGEYSAVQINLPRENRTQFFAITPVFDDMPGLLDRIPGIDRATNKTLSVASNYYCLYYNFYASDGLSTNGVLVYRRGGASNIVTVTEPPGGGEFLEFNFEFVRPLYQTIRDSARGAQKEPPPD